jgi:hypothetical protein
LEPEVGIEPTTYRLQGGRSAYTMTTSIDGLGPSITNITVRLQATPFRTTFDATPLPAADAGQNLGVSIKPA